MENLQMISICLLLGIIFIIAVCLLVKILAKAGYQFIITDKKIEILPVKGSPLIKHNSKKEH